MTLVASSPQSTLPTKASYNDVNSDTQSQGSDEENVTTLQNYRPMDSLVQSLGFPGDGLPTQFGQVSIDNSSDVHFGDKNFYQGPVTIRQIVYANGTPLVTNSDQSNNKVGGKDNLAYEPSDASNSDYQKDGVCVDLKASDKRNNCDKNNADAEQNGESDGKDLPLLRKGLIWFQNLSKYKPIPLGFFGIILVLFLIVLTTILLIRHPVTTMSVYDTDEQDGIKPLEYDSDITAASQIKNKLRIVTRIEWVAQPPINDTTPLITPVPYVIIQHTATENCSSIGQCVLHVRFIQTFHIDSRGYYDIGYNFLVGGDGAAYEGRGWTVEGAHTFGYNSRSIGIAFIGTFISHKPPEIQILAAKKLIQRGIELGYIKKNYVLLAARQLAGTESPGAALYEDIKTWPHWSKEP